MEFEWNELKAKANVSKHGITFEEVVTCFYDSYQIAFCDPEHSDEEDREIMIARSNQGRLLLVVYTLRGDCVRIISARQATKREGENYEKRI